MDKLKEKDVHKEKVYKGYRSTTIGKALEESIAEIKSKHPEISESLAEKIRKSFDYILPAHLENKSSSKVAIRGGKLKTYTCLDHEWSLDLRDVEVRDAYQVARVPRLVVHCNASKTAKMAGTNQLQP